MTEHTNWLDDVDAALENVEFGKAFIEVTKHNNKIIGVVVQGVSRSTKYKGDNTEAVTDLLSRVKRMSDTEHSGSSTATIVFKNGKITRIVDSEVTESRYNV